MFLYTNKLFRNVFSLICYSIFVCVRYTDDHGNLTEQYPMNPNGSIKGIAAVCSKNGRHLAMMPHPERCTEVWQWPWKPPQWTKEWNNDKNCFEDYKMSAWQRLFDNAYFWCQNN